MTGDHGEGIAGAIDDPRRWVQLAVSAGYKLTKGLPAADQEADPLARQEGDAAGKGQREVAGHAQLCVYDYLIRVPFVFSAPGIAPAGKKIDTQVRHIDIAPTILDAVGIDPAPYGLQPSLLPMMRGEDTTDRPAMTEALQTMLHDSVNRLIGLRTGKYKYIAAPDDPSVPREVYDLDADPREQHNLASSQPGAAGGARGTAHQHPERRDLDGDPDVRRGRGADQGPPRSARLRRVGSTAFDGKRQHASIVNFVSILANYPFSPYLADRKVM